MQIIDGKHVSSMLRIKLKEQIIALKSKHNKKMGLAVVLASDNAASRVYVKNKIEACKQLEIDSYQYEFGEDITNEKLFSLIDELNSNDEINGILVQLPLFPHLNEKEILKRISVAKDVDGFSAYQMGTMVLGSPELVACTPKGIMELLKWYNINVTGMNAVVIGRSNIVGKPIANLLLQADATVTVCHTKTKNLTELCKNADLIVAAVGKAFMVKADMVKEGAVVIDVGMNRLEDGRLVGDVDFENVKEKAAWITPVPGGVGPMTITMLMANTVRAYDIQNAK